MKNILILGGGFAGLWAAMAAATEKEKNQDKHTTITLVSDSEYLTIKPKLYQKTHEAMRVPLAPLLDKININFVHDSVIHINQTHCATASGRNLNYDSLVFALGSRTDLKGLQGATDFAYTLDSYTSNDTLYSKLDELVDVVENTVNVCIVGSGFTGIELATELKKSYGSRLSIKLIEKDDSIGKTLGHNMQAPLARARSRTLFDQF